MFSITDLPALNATLNLTCAVLLMTGYYFIRRKNIRAHKTCMLSALLVASLFLTSYLTYHYHVGSVRFTREGWIRILYFSILISHTSLAVVIVPMALRTIYLGWTGRLEKHVRIARWTFPLWIYVSITGVVVYLMLYQL